jgi:hypothetical protein
MNVRLVAYRQATTSATSDSTYQLDLQEAPSISLNYQFSDIKEPETRKASFSQTFKLPFTDSNNEFFQNWFNVNLTSLVFSASKKFNAVLYVGTVPQFEGFIQLKAVFLKAQVYEIVLMSNTADLFSAIGSQKLRDVFKNEDGTYSNELNHTYNNTNISASWDGSSSSFQNTSGVSLRDTDADVQKVMYPLSFTVPKAYYNGSNTYLGMSDVSGDDAGNYIVPITQFRPAVQLRTLFKLIMARAGFTYTSTFIDTDYFGRLFMTTCGHIGLPNGVEVQTAASVDGYMSVGNDAEWGTYNLTLNQGRTIAECGNNTTVWTTVPANTDTPAANYTTPYDGADCWDTTTNKFTKLAANMNSIKVRFVVETTNVVPQTGDYAGIGCLDNGQGILWEIQLLKNLTSDAFNYTTIQNDYNGGASIGFVRYFLIEFELDLNGLNVGESCFIQVRPRYYATMSGQTGTIKVGAAKCLPENNVAGAASTCAAANYLFSNMYNEITVSWVGYASNIYGQTVDVPGGIDDSITQKAFLKELIQRFNLVIMADPDDASNIIIEPYNDYLSGGELKDFTDKLDLDKEVVVKDTTSLQKQKVLFTDLEDKDLLNKSIAEEMPDYNVYGKVDIRETLNQFASGEMKNDPLFSPYINEKVFVNNNENAPTLIANMAVQYEYTYKQTNTGYEDVLEATKPKLFYYCGVPTTLDGVLSNYYMHSVNSGTGAITAHAFDKYPLCSPFELTPNAAGISTITNTTKSLYWNQNPPVCGQLTVFNYTPQSTITTNSLYYLYWSQYLNGIYNTDARIMECHLNLNEVDIFNFRFNDEIFIKDSYWRILSISNYQVGGKASTKVKLLKVDETYDGTCNDCDQVLATYNGSNTIGPFYLWCDSNSPGCTPNFGTFSALFVSQECCECFGGTPFTAVTAFASSGLYPCFANTGSLPIQLANIFNNRSLFSGTQTKKLYSGKINGLNKPIITGQYNTKYSTPILAPIGNDIIVKYNSNKTSLPQLDGESHRVVLTGHTIGTTRGYAYIQGDDNEPKLTVPINTNMMVRVNGISTVVGGSSVTHPIGNTEAFSYYTAFKNVGGIITQIGLAGGNEEFTLKESGASTCSLYIINTNNLLSFGLDDSQSNTIRIWQLTTEVNVNRVYNMETAYVTAGDYALFQNGDNILFQNGDDMLWN